jgi:pyrroline-5-carboxylate reductase
MKKGFLEVIEKQEILQILENSGFGEKIEALLLNESKVYTKKGRLNKSGACRILGMKPKELEDFLAKCRDAIKADQFLD